MVFDSYFYVRLTSCADMIDVLNSRSILMVYSSVFERYKMYMVNIINMINSFLSHKFACKRFTFKEYVDISSLLK